MDCVKRTSWGDRIRDARAGARLSQRALAELIGGKQQTVADWESGKSEPSLHSFELIARATGTTAGWLAFGIAPADAEPERMAV
jgi:transcriptional regulator with XRE-family HTH domain